MNFECSDCQKLFSSTYNLKSHFERMHSNNKILEENGRNICKDFKCVFCTKSFACKIYLDNHIQSLHESTLKFKCDLCGKQFKRKMDLKFHVKIAHENNESQMCILCDRKFRHKIYLAAHMKTAHEKSKSDFECSHCKKLYSSKYHLKKHIIIQIKITHVLFAEKPSNTMAT